MSLLSLSAWLTSTNRGLGSSRPSPRRRLGRHRNRFAPLLEALETRAVPSVSYHFTTIDDPNAGTNGSNGVQGTFVAGINDSGEISGNYGDANNVTHGFLLAHGQFTTYNDPDAGTAPFQGTAGFGLNNRGQVVGEYFDTTPNPLTGGFDIQGFLLSHGQYTTLDDPNATGGVTAAANINDRGQIVGAYLDANSVWHAYVFANGHYTTLDDPNAGTGAFQGTEALAINASGEIVGWYFDANNVTHGFVLSHGQYTTLDDPNAGTRAGQGTYAEQVNASGKIVGYYTDANNVNHAFMLSHGQYTTFDDPNAGTGAGQGTFAFGINDSGKIVGSYVDDNNTIHGFLATPSQQHQDDIAIGVVSTFAGAARLSDATPLGSLTVNAPFVANSGYGQHSVSMSKSPAIVTDPTPLLAHGDANVAVDAVFGSIDDLFEPLWAT
jgi:probable HAF family extracellular repeat protein